jgi:hypothetical protein
MRWFLAMMLAFALGAPARAAEPVPDSGTINIMRPEPGTPAAKHDRTRKSQPRREATSPQGYGVKEDTRRGSSDTVYPAPLPGLQAPLPVPHIEASPQRPLTPPPLHVPETGRALPNLPAIGSGPNGAETLQDKSARCAHQAGVYGPNVTGNPNAYIGSCINQ